MNQPPLQGLNHKYSTYTTSTCTPLQTLCNILNIYCHVLCCECHKSPKIQILVCERAVWIDAKLPQGLLGEKPANFGAVKII